MFRPHETELTQRKEEKTRVIFATACSLTSDRFVFLFFSLSFAGLSPTLFFPIFQICGHDNINLSFENTLHNSDTEKISAFRFHLY